MINSKNLSAQLQNNLSSYQQNKFLYNPAYAGAEGFSSFNLTTKDQWLGFDQSPSIQVLSAQTRLLKRGYKIFDPLKNLFKGKADKNQKFKMYSSQTGGKVGLGAFIYHEQKGLINNTGLQLAYSYHIYIKGTQISFGLGSSFAQFRLNEKKMIINGYDPLVSSTESRMLIPDAKVGVFLLNRVYYAGLSANNLLESALKIGNKLGISYQEQRLYCLIAGVYVPLNSNIILEPSTLIKIDEGRNKSIDLRISSNFKSKIEAGLTYRSTREIIVLTGIYLKGFFVAYAFDYPFNDVGRYSLGSHEISLSFKIGSGERRFRYQDRY